MSLALVTEDGVPHEIDRLRRDLAAAKRMLQAAHEELEAERDARLRYFNENSRLKGLLKRQEAEYAEDELVKAVFEFWSAMCRPRAKLGTARVKAIQARLRDKPPTTPGEFFKAIVGAAHAPFIKDDKVYDDLELICRNESKLESFAERFYRVPDVRAFIEASGGERAIVAARALMDLERRQAPSKEAA